MRILLTNDDGYDSKGLYAVADLFYKDHEIAIVAPNVQKSGFSHSLTMKPDTVSYKKIGGRNYDVFAVDGTPVDCVKLARNRLFHKPDIVISGINCGQNLGSDIMYSGTVAAAADAAHSGFRAMALSLDVASKSGEVDYTAFAKFVNDNFDVLLKIDLPRTTILNINYPTGVPRGVKFVRMNTQETFVDRYDEADKLSYFPTGHRDYSTLDRETDEWYCKNGYITITPINTDRTDYATLDRLCDEEFKL